MKLIFCTKCYDVIKLDSKLRKCKCKKSGGRYLDDLNAEYWGDSIPLGFDNHSLVEAISSQPIQGNGKKFEAFVIPLICPTMKKL